MFIILFIILDIVKHNVHHWPGPAEVILVISLVVGILELILYGLAFLGIALGVKKALK